MTIRWCAYCQRFMGETAPFENFEISHGLCPICAEKGLDRSVEEMANLRVLQSIQKKLWDAGNSEVSNSEAEVLIDEANAAGVRPIDIL